MPDMNHMLLVPIKYKLDPSVPVNQRHVIICEDLWDPKVVDTGFRYVGTGSCCTRTEHIAGIFLTCILTTKERIYENYCRSDQD